MFMTSEVIEIWRVDLAEGGRDTWMKTPSKSSRHELQSAPVATRRHFHMQVHERRILYRKSRKDLHYTCSDMERLRMQGRVDLSHLDPDPEGGKTNFQTLKKLRERGRVVDRV